MNQTEQDRVSTFTPYVESIIAELDHSWHMTVRKVLGDIQSPPGGEGVTDQRDLDQAAYLIACSIDDCESLDTHGGGGLFTKRFRVAMGGPITYAAIIFKIRKPQNDKSWKPIRDAMGIGETETEQAFTIHRMREMARDGNPPDVVSQIFSKEIQACVAGDNSTAFLIKTGRLLAEMKKHPEKYNRPIIGWIERAWLPLALWEIVHDPRKIHDRLLLAMNCHPPVRDLKLEWPEFMRAWSKVKPTNRRDID